MVGSEEKIVIGPCHHLSSIEVSLPNHYNRLNKCKTQHQELPNLWVWNPHHGQVVFGQVVGLVECCHHAWVLEHDEQVLDDPPVILMTK